MKRYVSLFVVTALTGLMFLLLKSNYSEYFDKIENDYKENIAVNLAPGVRADDIEEMLLTRGYIDSREEAGFVAGRLVEGVRKGYDLSNIYSLKKNVWKVSWRVADSLKGTSINTRYEKALDNLGLRNNVVAALKRDTSTVDFGKKDGGTIVVSITEKDSAAGSLARVLGNDVKPVDSVLVCLKHHYMMNRPGDSKAGVESSDTLINEIIAYAVTGKDGKVFFKGLDKDASYSVLPLSHGYEYGSSKGTIGGTLGETSGGGELELAFTQKEMKVTLFGNQTLKRIKEDTALTVRSPQEYNSLLFRNVLIFIAMWWGVVLFLEIRKRRPDIALFSALMLLTGVCLMNMFSVNDPLTDKMLGTDMANGVFIGLIIVALISNVDFVKFYQDRSRIRFDFVLDALLWLIKPFRRKVAYMAVWMRERNFMFKCIAAIVVLCCLPLLLLDLLFVTRLSAPVEKALKNAPKGVGYLFLALLLTLLLFSPFGKAIGGMRVNLDLGLVFQPSEIAKYLIVFFMAAYFCRNADNIVKYSAEGNASLFGNKMKLLGWIVAGLGVLMLLYLTLGDMGPALVLAFTFIFMYSLVKSKVDCYDENGRFRISKVLVSDIAMLLYGIVSFLLCLWLGDKMGSLFLGGVAWFVVWIAGGIAVRKQVFESPVLFNLIVFAFVFGGQMLSAIGMESASERLESRRNMCTNTWGVLGINGEIAEPGENMQVAQGLWALASGGIFGQGLAEGSPHDIPAFHTDMVLESIGEQMGFVGLFAVVIALAIFLRRLLVTGFRTNHPFTFYLCLGIAIVTAVQFLIISLGSTGVIPLTGVTVPFLSYGRVSMILNLVAAGVAIAISLRPAKAEEDAVAEVNRLNMRKYTYSLSVLIFAYMAMMLLVLGVFLNYQLFNRDKTLVRPLYVKGDAGNTTVEYNPRIFDVTDKMHAGNIYDRNGVLLATSNYDELESEDFYRNFKISKMKQDHRARYYPFGEHLYFMLGDANSRLFFQASDKYGIGYVAEYQHMSELRGYDNTMYDEYDRPVKLQLQKVHRPSVYMAYCDTVAGNEVTIRDYSAIVPFLKAGANSFAVKCFNEGETFGEVGKKDLQLTVDALLQTRLQLKMEEFVKTPRLRQYSGKLRMSVVLLDANNGDLLASSVYPLPDEERLAEEGGAAYDDRNKGKDWVAYTNEDLGIRFATHPGSTAKVMSAIAGVNTLGAERMRDIEYHVDTRQFTGLEPKGDINLRLALVKSSNCYFINLANEYDLYSELADIYGKVGATYNGERVYTIDYKEYDSSWAASLKNGSTEAISTYNYYNSCYKENRLPRGRNPKDGWKMRWNKNWLVTWGQGDLDATPLAMARVASVVVNDGRMPVTKFVLGEKDSLVFVSSPADIALVKQYMVEEAMTHHARISFPSNFGGKTGTAERNYGNKTGNDVWYICFAEGAEISSKALGEEKPERRKGDIAIAVRIERLSAKTYSDIPKSFVKDWVVPLLRDMGYGDLLAR